jgi:hypothetical protein
VILVSLELVLGDPLVCVPLFVLPKVFCLLLVIILVEFIICVKMLLLS